MTELKALCPKDEQVWMTYYNRQNELMFFLTGPANMSSTLTAQTGAFALYSVISGRKAKKLGTGGNPTELEMKYKVAEALKEIEKAS